MAKCVEIPCPTDGYPLVIRNPLALHYISHIGGGEQPPKFTVLGKTSWEAWRRWHGRGAMGQKQHL